MGDPHSWHYFEHFSELKPKRKKVYISCSHSRYRMTDSYVIIQTFPLDQSLIHGDENLQKGLDLGKKDVRVFGAKCT
ncbi:hypothetical protein [Prochlorococcus marinus]|uniref:hypothetical protein n=1 Tax=Prochlorococcus marinus TaxID=1219 RepID=UPI0005A1EF09|nr:hypothetical protein [Prochlorococcus marinus]